MELVPGLIITALTIALVKSVLHSWRSIGSFPVSLKWAGCRQELFSRTRACVRELTAGLRSLNAGYHDV